MMSIIKVILTFSLLGLASSRPRNKVSYNDLEHMGASCPERDNCNGYHNNLTYVDRSCECDQLCVYYDDCCANAPARLNYRRYSARGNMDCLHYGGMAHTGVFVVSTCSRNWNGSDEIREKCSGPADWRDPLTNIPATDIAQAVTYRNLFCAECNNANMRSLKNFQIHISCEGFPVQLTPEEIFGNITYNEEFHSWGLYRNNSLGNETVYYGCNMVFHVPEYLNHSVRFCRSDIVSTCAPNWDREEIRQQCEEYMSVVYDNENGYKNPHCAICNDRRVDHLSCTPGVLGRRRPMSFALFLDINQDDGDLVGMRRVPIEDCPPNHKFDPFFKKCRRLVCAIPGKKLVNGRCV